MTTPIKPALRIPTANNVPARLPAKGLIARAACSPATNGIWFTNRVAAVATIMKKEKKSVRKAPQ